MNCEGDNSLLSLTLAPSTMAAGAIALGITTVHFNHASTPSAPLTYLMTLEFRITAPGSWSSHSSSSLSKPQ
ncbi:hypothetical protein EUGRSUZ_C02198 [Eucalyptus grandis]|uniref:Uncharacterized protein n=3 Tax=Eucalyptus TaxID=3932 RepID=A0ACC3LEW7_EUCGR|nr:hypothetical protein EUGRSUZ_C02198 [Eucalyptus grandis]